ncbi:ABC transporter permease [Frankia sp. AgKG'84/4]|uniref:ABC transporter permease n=1 Tax=Frankia sp. AgKG'84/4 TaxID=573490 RepID=UPI00200F3FBF|nr:ABC transporter permease subunit [Frankia sp. AgKG'84/4]MCL9794213.1 ABC transporter permease subunit [Frankia sp. AgKG'84/4]
MATLTGPAAPPLPPTPTATRALAGAGRAVRAGWWRWTIFAIAAVYFLVPLIAALEFSLRGRDGHRTIGAYGKILSEPEFGSALWSSVKLGLMAVAITLALLVPTMTLVHLRFPKLRRVIETITVLPLVIPPVVLAVGVLGAFRTAPQWLIGTPTILGFEYVILALPFAYRALDAGIGAVDLRTLVEASRGLGAGPVTALFRVVLPNLRTAVLSAAVLTLALVLGEFAMASLLLWDTFPSWVVHIGASEADVSVAVSLVALVLTWLLLMVLVTLGGRRGGRAFVGVLTGGTRDE